MLSFYRRNINVLTNGYLHVKILCKVYYGDSQIVLSLVYNLLIIAAGLTSMYV